MERVEAKRFLRLLKKPHKNTEEERFILNYIKRIISNDKSRTIANMYENAHVYASSLRTKKVKPKPKSRPKSFIERIFGK